MKVVADGQIFPGLILRILNTWVMAPVKRKLIHPSIMFVVVVLLHGLMLYGILRSCVAGIEDFERDAVQLDFMPDFA